MSKATYILFITFITFFTASAEITEGALWKDAQCNTLCNRITCKQSTTAESCVTNCQHKTIKACTDAHFGDGAKVWDTVTCRATCNRVTCLNPLIGFPCVHYCKPGQVRHCQNAYDKWKRSMGLN